MTCGEFGTVETIISTNPMLWINCCEYEISADREPDITESCNKCNGTGKIDSTCPQCKGSGKDEQWTCPEGCVISNYDREKRYELTYYCGGCPGGSEEKQTILFYDYEEASEYEECCYNCGGTVLKSEGINEKMVCPSCECEVTEEPNWVLDSCTLCEGDGIWVRPLIPGA